MSSTDVLLATDFANLTTTAFPHVETTTDNSTSFPDVFILPKISYSSTAELVLSVTAFIAAIVSSNDLYIYMSVSSMCIVRYIHQQQSLSSFYLFFIF